MTRPDVFTVDPEDPRAPPQEVWEKRIEHDRNVALYAELGIPEYFVFDRGRLNLRGHRLPSPGARAYQPIVPQGGRYASAMLGLELMLVEGRLRFVVGGTPLLESEEIIGQLETMVDGLVQRREEDERALEEARRQLREERKRVEEERKRADEAERRAAALQAEIDQLRNGKP
ncbi:Uma2 family endonuclease [Polyangium spumosum]|uniref:Uncharacterized protein n=1 Tax=Polyangium spumosum TaxID=889282 RepID=A0A6N7PXL6_9BACT|nr:Uma2 family endonuclease [Polyangium spumosum]MRG96828.1 hypothetical protein [Polyangium spumosum]